MVCDPLTIEDMLFHVQNQWTTSIYDLKNGVLLKVPRNPTNFAFICTQVGLILDIFLFFVCKKHYSEK